MTAIKVTFLIQYIHTIHFNPGNLGEITFKITPICLMGFNILIQMIADFEIN